MKWQTIALILLAASPTLAQDAVPLTKCDNCVAWNVNQKPFRVFGNTYYIGTHELSSILIVTDQGLVVIDGDLAESAPQIARHIRELGFDPKNIKLILNSHAHFDHASGLAWLQKESVARVALSPWSTQALTTGADPADDPQVALHEPAIAPLKNIQTVKDGEAITEGNVTLTAHFTPGHTPGGTSWSWTSCEGTRCLHIVYADSLTAVSAPDYRYTDHPDLLRGFDKSFSQLEAIPCDILLSPHPGFAHTLDELKARDGGNADAFIDPQSCRTYAAEARQGLQKRLAQEAAAKKR